MWRYLFTLSPTEIWVFAMLSLSGCALLIFSLVKRKHTPAPPPPPPETKNSLKKAKVEKREKELIVTEIFDYNGVKILHEKGVYTVNERGIIAQHSSWDSLPKKYQRMILELDQRSQGQKGEDYFLEMLNGFYYISEPNGKKKRYDSIDDIPPRIRKNVGL